MRALQICVLFHGTSKRDPKPRRDEESTGEYFSSAFHRKSTPAEEWCERTVLGEFLVDIACDGSLRQAAAELRSAVFTPASCCFRIPKGCSSVYQLFFMPVLPSTYERTPASTGRVFRCRSVPGIALQYIENTANNDLLFFSLLPRLNFRTFRLVKGLPICRDNLIPFRLTRSRYSDTAARLRVAWHHMSRYGTPVSGRG
jgi:hypothetical protein